MKKSGIVSAVGELPGAQEEISKKKPRIGILTLKVGSNTRILKIIDRVFDYYTLDFLPKDPKVFMAYERSDMDIFDENKTRDYIYLNIRNFST